MNKAGTLSSKIVFWAYDLVAGSAVFLVALPLCLGIALASDAPIASGLITGVVGGIVVGILSGSHTSVSGPAAGLTAVVASQIGALGSFEIFLAALVIAGLTQIVMGMARVGAIAKFFPSSVIRGLLAAIGIILILKQLPHLVGWDVDADGEMAFLQLDHENTFSEIGKMFFHLHPGAMLIGILSLVILFAWDKIPRLKKSKLPSSLVVVVIGALGSFILPFVSDTWLIGSEHLVQVPIASDFLSMVQFFKLPHWDAFLSAKVYIVGITLALVASLETLLNLEAIDKIDPLKRTSPANRELVAQGIGNTFLGIIGGLPVTSVIVRSSVNINAGGKTKISAIAHGVFLLLSAMFIPHVLNTIPLSCLAAILIATGVKLASPKIIKNMWEKDINQFVPFAVTVIAIVFTDLLVGVLVGLITSVAFIIINNLKRPLHVIQEQRMTGDVQRVRLPNQVSFLNRGALNQLFEGMSTGGHILIDATHTDYIDADILNLITEFKHEIAPARNVTVSLKGFKEEHRLENVIHYPEHATPQLQQHLSPLQVLQILKDGNERVLRGKPLQRDLSRQITATASGQFPIGVVLSCMDSRAPVELIFDLGIGDIFSVRMAGNTISQRVLGSLEFACAIAGAKLIVVMGHTRCGAIGASIESYWSKTSIEQSTGCAHLGSIVDDIKKVIDNEPDNHVLEKKSRAYEAFERRITRAHVQECINNIVKESATISRLIKEGKIAIIGSIYDVGTGSVDFIDKPLVKNKS